MSIQVSSSEPQSFEEATANKNSIPTTTDTRLFPQPQQSICPTSQSQPFQQVFQLHQQELGLGQQSQPLFPSTFGPCQQTLTQPPQQQPPPLFFPPPVSQLIPSMDWYNPYSNQFLGSPYYPQQQLNQAHHQQQQQQPQPQPQQSLSNFYSQSSQPQQPQQNLMIQQMAQLRALQQHQQQHQNQFDLGPNANGLGNCTTSSSISSSFLPMALSNEQLISSMMLNNNLPYLPSAQQLNQTQSHQQQQHLQQQLLMQQQYQYQQQQILNQHHQSQQSPNFPPPQQRQPIPTTQSSQTPLDSAPELLLVPVSSGIPSHQSLEMILAKAERASALTTPLATVPHHHHHHQLNQLSASHSSCADTTTTNGSPTSTTTPTKSLKTISIKDGVVKIGYQAPAAGNNGDLNNATLFATPIENKLLPSLSALNSPPTLFRPISDDSCGGDENVDGNNIVTTINPSHKIASSQPQVQFTQMQQQSSLPIPVGKKKTTQHLLQGDYDRDYHHHQHDNNASRDDSDEKNDYYASTRNLSIYNILKPCPPSEQLLKPCPRGIKCPQKSFGCKYKFHTLCRANGACVYPYCTFIHTEERLGIEVCPRDGKCVYVGCRYRHPTGCSKLRLEECPYGQDCALIGTFCKYALHNSGAETRSDNVDDSDDDNNGGSVNGDNNNNNNDDEALHSSPLANTSSLLTISTSPSKKIEGPCPYGSKCKFIFTCKYSGHNLCSLDSRCTNRRCLQNHTRGQGFVKLRCQNGSLCKYKNTTCRFLYHPETF